HTVGWNRAKGSESPTTAERPPQPESPPAPVGRRALPHDRRLHSKLSAAQPLPDADPDEAREESRRYLYHCSRKGELFSWFHTSAFGSHNVSGAFMTWLDHRLQTKNASPNRLR